MPLTILVRLFQDSFETIRGLMSRPLKVLAIVLDSSCSAEELIAVLVRHDGVPARVYNAINEKNRAFASLFEIDSSRLFIVVGKEKLTSSRTEVLSKIVEAVYTGERDTRTVASYPIFIFEQPVPDSILSMVIRITIPATRLLWMKKYMSSLEGYGFDRVLDEDIEAARGVIDTESDDCDKQCILAMVSILCAVYKRLGLESLCGAITKYAETWILPESGFTNENDCGFLFWRATGFWMLAHERVDIPESKKCEVSRQELKSVVICTDDSYYIGADVYKETADLCMRLFGKNYVKNAIVNEKLLIPDPNGKKQTYIYLKDKDAGRTYRLNRKRFDYEG